MKTRNFIKILFLSTAIVSSGACSKHGSQAQQESERIDPPSQTRPESLHEQSLALSPPPAPPARRTTPPLNQEAVVFAETRLIESWTKVGDSWFTLHSQNRPRYIQVKGMKCTVESQKLSEAEALNGIEWRGEVEISGSAYREYAPQTHTWSEWRNGEPDDVYSTLRHYIAKKKGEWGDDENAGNKYQKPEHLTKPSEEQIKAIPGL